MESANLVIVATTNAAGAPVANGAPSLKVVRASLFRILNENVLCSMATVTSDYQAYVNTAYFSYSENLELYFVSHPGSGHCRNLETNPSMAMTVFSSSQAWGSPDQGLQLFGTCALARGADAIKALNSYAGRFPTYMGWQRSLSPEDPGKNYQLYRFLGNRVKVFDEHAWGKPLTVLAAVIR
jgi:uncharacterized protein YhbP (UPF0306 family)